MRKIFNCAHSISATRWLLAQPLAHSLARQLLLPEVGAKAGSDRGSADSATASTRGSDSEQQEKELKGGMLRADVAASA